MPELHIPLVSGATESVDAKLTPQGRILRAENVRYLKDGRLGLRNGYAYDASGPSGVVSSFDAGGALVSVSARTSYNAKPTYSVRTTSGWDNGKACSTLGDMAAPIRYQTVRDRQAYAVDSIASEDGKTLYVVSGNYDRAATTNVGITVYAIDAATGRTVRTSALDNVVASCPKAVMLGQQLTVFYGDTTANKVYARELDTVAWTWSPAVEVASVLAGTASNFDVCANGTTRCYVALQFAAGQIDIYTADAGLVFASFNSQGWTNLGGSYNSGRMSICWDAVNSKVVLVWCGRYQNGAQFHNALKYSEWNALGGPLVSDAVLVFPNATSSGCTAAPTVAPHDSLGWICAADGTYNLSSVDERCVFLAWKAIAGAQRTLLGFTTASRPFMFGSGCYVWTVDRVTDTSTPGTYMLLDMGSATLVGPSGAYVPMVCARAEALPRATASTYTDPRRNGGVSVVTNGTAPGSAQVMCALPIVAGNDIYVNGVGADVVRLERGTWAPRHQAAHINGQTLLSGPLLLEWDGSRLTESGLWDGPIVRSVAATVSAGKLVAGTYRYCVTWEWTDAQGRRHQSPPSAETSVTFGADSFVTVIIEQMPASAKGSLASLHAILWRTTLADPNTFYRVPTAYHVLPNGPDTLVDTFTDAALSGREVLYTQGERGAISGLLPHDPPPPCRFICSSPDRVLVGGLDDTTAVQWSKLRYPGEPMEWSYDLAYVANVDGAVTGVACMDGAWYVFTADSVYAFTGQGPDDQGAGGTFGDAQRIPSETGCISYRSIVASGAGVYFQGRDGQIWLLPRGGGAPQRASLQVRDRLDAFPFVSAAVAIEATGEIVWACTTSDGSSGIMLHLDTRLGEWTVSDYFGGAHKALAVYADELAIDGNAFRAGHLDTAVGGTLGVCGVIETGDVRPFGIIGDGRTREVQILGEYATDSAFELQLEVSYDSGITYDDTVTWTMHGAEGAAFERSHRLKQVRGCAYRFRISINPSQSAADAAAVLNALSFEVFPERGLKRLAGGSRG